MNQETKENITNKIAVLVQNNSKYQFSEIKSSLNLRSKEDNKKAKKIFNKLTGVRLFYSKRKNGSDKIHKITNDLEKLIKDNNLDFDANSWIVLLTEANATKIEELISKDPDCFPFSQIIFNYFGYNNVINNNKMALFAVIREIDRDNNTNVWRYKKNRKSFNNLVNYIADPNNKFFEKLKKGYKDLPDIICKNCGNGLKSLSSKVCKYLSEFAEFGDNYYINDRFIRHALLFYLDFYGVKKVTSSGKKINSTKEVDKLSYENLFDLLQKLHSARDKKHQNQPITKNNLDHIIWYCYKSFKL